MPFYDTLYRLPSAVQQFKWTAAAEDTERCHSMTIYDGSSAVDATAAAEWLRERFGSFHYDPMIIYPSMTL